MSKKRGTTLAEQIKLLHATRSKAKHIKVLKDDVETKGSLKKRRQISL